MTETSNADELMNTNNWTPENVHNQKLVLMHPEAVDDHRYSMGLVDSFSRYRKFLFFRSRVKPLEM